MVVPDASGELKFALMSMQSDDYPSVSRIFTQGIETGNATYDTAAAVWEDWDAKHLMHSRWVVKSVCEGSVLGWAALSPVSSRRVFSGVAELSIYIDTDFLGQGLGNVLMNALIASSEENGIWMLQSGIFPENQASIALHEKFGFRLVGKRERIGKMANGIWRDIVLLERRSSVVD
ncbi:MAG: N-acetyltransferase family protein [Bacteroidetes bacterium]|nr:N-acetyltransferase family protein [Bacteroidota bacterium]